MEDILNPHTPLPTPGDPLYPKNRRNAAYLRMEIMNSLPQDILPAIDLDPNTSPLQLTEAIKNHFKESTSTAHTILRQEAQRTKLTTSESLDTYLQTHRNIRLRMQLVDYPRIKQDESTRIDFIIQGLETHETFKHLHDTWVETYTMPTTIRSLKHRLKSVQARVAEKDASNTTTPQDITIAPSTPKPAGQNNETRRYRGRSRGRERAQSHWPRPWFPHAPTYAPQQLHSFPIPQ